MLVSHNPATPPEPPEPVETDPPQVVDRPYANQTGSTLNCTMGNWDNMQAEPHSYQYEWRCDGMVFGTTASYVVAPADVGHSFACTVTAINAAGQASSISNSVVVAAAP